MANALYDKAREDFLGGTLSWSGDTIKVVGVDSGYTFSAAHTNLSQVASGDRVSTSAALSGKTITNGVADANDTVLPSVTNGVQVVGLVVYKDTGVEATSRLIAFIDTGTNIPVTGNGGDVNVAWSAATERIFKL